MFQQTHIIGHLGADPEMRYTTSGVAVASFSVATKKSWTGADGQRQEKTVWFRCSSWNKQAEIITQYLHKGSKVHVIGELEEPRVFTDRSGEARSSLEMRTITVTFLDSKGDAPGQPGAAQPQAQAQAAAPVTSGNGQAVAAEEIPF